VARHSFHVLHRNQTTLTAYSHQWVISAILFFSEMAPGTKALLIFHRHYYSVRYLSNYTSLRACDFNHKTYACAKTSHSRLMEQAIKKSHTSFQRLFSPEKHLDGTIGGYFAYRGLRGQDDRRFALSDPHSPLIILPNGPISTQYLPFLDVFPRYLAAYQQVSHARQIRGIEWNTSRGNRHRPSVGE